MEMPNNDQSMQRMTGGELRSPMAAPDETGARMPPEMASAINSSWIYGDPTLGYAGQSAAGAISPAEIQAPAAPAATAAEAGTVTITGLNGTGELGGISSAAAQSQRMKNPVDMEGPHMPADAGEAYQASLRSLLNRNVGYFVVATFMVGTQQAVTWQGILHTVGSDYIVLYQPDYERYISGDLYSLKFVQFHNVKGVPYCAAAQSWQGQTSF